MRTVSIGDICDSRVYISVEYKPWHNWHELYKPWLGPTYNGTVAGIVWQLGRLIILCHVRSDKALVQ